MATRRILSMPKMLWLAAAIGCNPACAGTRLTVRVDAPKNAPKAGFYTRVGSVDDRCIPAGPHDVTDEAGLAHISEEYCGNLQLMVAAPGYRTERRVIDTCEVGFARVEMHPAAPVSNPNDDCSTTALSIIKAWLSKDEAALRDALVESRLAR